MNKDQPTPEQLEALDALAIDQDKVDVDAAFADREDREWHMRFAYANRATKKRMLAEKRQGRKWKKGQRHA